MSLASDRSPNDLLVVAAMRAEVRALRAGGARRVERCGAGPVRARRMADRLLAEDADRIVVSGFCGALVPELVPGDVVIASEIRGAGPVFRTEIGASLRRRLEESGLRVCAVPLVSVDHVVRGSERRVWAARGLRAVDMESAWLAAGAAGRPLAVVRVVLDGPAHELMRPAFLRQWRQATRALRTVGSVLAADDERTAVVPSRAPDQAVGEH